MNKKCFNCFDNIINSLNDGDLLDDWIEFRSEELETNLSEEDKEYLLKFDDFAEKILTYVPDKDSNLVSDLLNEIRDDFYHYCIYWNEKYYKTGFSDAVKILLSTLNE